MKETISVVGQAVAEAIPDECPFVNHCTIPPIEAQESYKTLNLVVTAKCLNPDPDSPACPGCPLNPKNGGGIKIEFKREKTA